MNKIMSFTAIALALGACTYYYPTPAAPRVMVLPGQGKTLAQFQQDDAGCRSYASAQSGYIPPGVAANQSAVASAGVGAVVGAAAGALIGAASGDPGTGAAIGAGTGLIFGSAAGTNAAQASAEIVQERYDTAYLQCMMASGNNASNVTNPYYYYPYRYYYPY
jgi:hypothetical protein